MRSTLSQITPNLFKKAYRLIRYKNERNKFTREVNIKSIQDRQIVTVYPRTTNKLIVFLVPGGDWATGVDKITGGTISIVSQCEQTSTMHEIHESETILCTANEEHLLLKHSMFDNQTDVYRFEQLNVHFNNLIQIIIHVPEYLLIHFKRTLSRPQLKWLRNIKYFHVNVMNQNIQLMPSSIEINQLKQIASSISITTAHDKYCTPEFRLKFAVPLHKLSVWISPEQYQFKIWKEKENLIIVSPDNHPLKDEILGKLAKIPNLSIQIIKNLKYNQYKALITRAKWALTFGEGLDGYLLEPVFSGAISFAVYNDEFFTPDFKYLSTIFPSIEILNMNINGLLESLDNETGFTLYQARLLTLCSKYYNKEKYRNNIKAFYQQQYTYP